MRNFALLFAVAAVLCGCSRGKKEKYVVVEQKLYSFPLSQVRIIGGPFKTAQDLNAQWLLSLEPERLMSGFFTESGLEPKAPKYGGWESMGVAGHTLGHYLSACAMQYAASGDEVYHDRIKYMMTQLDTCQKAFGGGMLAGFPRAKELFEEVARGDIRTQGFDLNGGWVPIYTQHKLFAGLIDVYRYTGNKEAKRILVAMSDWMEGILTPLGDEQLQQLLYAEHGGINESFADVYAITGNKKYLALALRLNHKAILDPLANGVDELAGKHANTQIPKVIGAIREFELTGDSTLFKTADFFWNAVVYDHTYVIGGNSEAEHFGMAGRNYDRITDRTCENCNTYNMLKLTNHLMRLEPSVEKADFYERALINQILASQNPDNGMVCYMSPLAAGSSREYSSPFDSFWCCVGSGIENHTRYGESIYFTDDDDNLFVNLYIPSELDWKKRGIKVTQQTDMPEEGRIELSFDMSSDSKFAVHLRVPSWAKSGYTLMVNDEEFAKGSESGIYVFVDRTWQSGDKLTCLIPMSVTSEGALGDSTLRAYMYGPVVLAALTEKGADAPFIIMDNISDAASAIEKVPIESLTFTMIKGKPENLRMIPYFRTGSHPMAVYFSHLTSAQWDERKDHIFDRQNREKWLREQTVSRFQPGEMQPERDHNLKGDNTSPGEMHGRKFRRADNGGWFSFTMNVLPDTPQNLICTYWGDLGDIYKFKILVDDSPIATAIIHWWGRSFIDKQYRIPYELTKGKDKVTVRFEALNNASVAGPLFDCKVVK